MPATFAYCAGMTTIQYTLRTVPKSVDSALRRIAATENKSLNTVAIEALTRGLELEKEGSAHSDLDALIGTWVEDQTFDQVIAEFGQVDMDVWK
jgi:hypothetical protein